MSAPLASHSPEDTQFLDDVPSRHIIGFRNASFPAAFIEKNPGFFLDNSWISVSKLKVFIDDQAPSFIPVHIPNASGASCPNPAPAASTEPHVKSEQHKPSFSSPKIKIEPGLPSVKPPTGVIVKTRISHEQGQDVIEIMDTDSDNDSIPIKREQTLQIMADFKMAIGDTNIPLDVELLTLAMSQDKVLDAKAFTQASSTRWDDEGLSSRVIHQSFQVTQSVKVNHVELLTELPTMIPCFLDTAFVFDLRDPKFILYTEQGKRMTPDALIKDKDQDAWTGGTGTADSGVNVTFFPGGTPVRCRRSRLNCRGLFACKEIDQALINVQRDTLDPKPREAILKAKQAARRDEGVTAEGNAAIFLNVIQADSQRCRAINPRTLERCNGRPILKSSAKKIRGQDFFIACDGWRVDFQTNHRTHTIPDNIDTATLSRLMDRGSATATDTEPCSVVVPTYVGFRQKYCLRSNKQIELTSAQVAAATQLVSPQISRVLASIGSAEIMNAVKGSSVSEAQQRRWEKSSARRCFLGICGHFLSHLLGSPAITIFQDPATPDKTVTSVRAPFFTAFGTKPEYRVVRASFQPCFVVFDTIHSKSPQTDNFELGEFTWSPTRYRLRPPFSSILHRRRHGFRLSSLFEFSPQNSHGSIRGCLRHLAWVLERYGWFQELLVERFCRETGEDMVWIWAKSG
ncbi:hypothetical protein C8J56DRAFT_1169810 [Mycena floridula]|nr:hypothetical protein C8J56DRAFT_1169810 [Mycena floridula]